MLLTAERKRLKEIEDELAAIKGDLFGSRDALLLESHPELHHRLDELMAEHARIQRKLQEEGA